ncbi:MAG: hypothetical protein DHS80DRAFT_20948 [Piptocephalis tieghemiana]|nr:MAG: hypothetical protein DHS80DRAFT_20948 [Piptocephalis tieghemiana]
MDITKDSNYDPKYPNETPCRWTGNMGNCTDSEEYFKPVAMVSLVISLSMIPVSLFLIYLTCSRSFRIHRPSTWSSTTSFYLASGFFGVLLAMNDVLGILDPPTPYWLRHFFFDLPYNIILVGVVPYVTSLTTPVQTLMPGGSKIIKAKLPLILAIRSIPAILLIQVICVFLRGLAIDLDLPMVSDTFTSIGLFLIALACFVISFACLFYGYRFSCTLRHSILLVEDVAGSKVKSASTPGYCLPFPPRSTHLKNVQSPSNTSFPGNNTLMDPSASRGLDSSMTSQSVNTTCNEAPRINKRQFTAIEARAVLGKVLYLNVILGIITLLSGICFSLMSILPSRIFTILILSKMVFFLLYVCSAASILLILLFNLFTEWNRRQSKKRLTVVEPPSSEPVEPSSNGQSPKTENIVDQAFQIEDAVRMVGSTMIEPDDHEGKEEVHGA